MNQFTIKFAILLQTFLPTSSAVIFNPPASHVSKTPEIGIFVPQIQHKMEPIPQTVSKPIETVQPVEVPQVPTPAPKVQTPTVDYGQTVPNCGDNSYANFIYMHESGCSTYNPNRSSGACGLGQAWPCSKLMNVCPNMDYACENAFFNNYANAAYGGWAASYAFWVAHNWW